jgi:hypothetical protein
MSQVTLQGNDSGTGIFTLAAPNSNTNRTLNLPDAAGDVVLTTATQTLTNKSISAAQINSGTLGVARGGTGASTLTANNVLLGNGTSALQAVAPGTSGNVLTSNGTTWTSAAPGGGAANVQTFNSNGTWTKPSTGSMARIQVWGGGGSGGRATSSNSGGGGGGGYNEIVVPLSTLGSTVTVTIGAGGTTRTTAGPGVAGGTSSFGSLCLAYGGGAGGNGTSGGGGGQLSAGSSELNFSNLGGVRYTAHGLPVQGFFPAFGGDSVSVVSFPTLYHGGVGRFPQAASNFLSVNNLHSAVYGGGAGGCTLSGLTDGGTSLYGGAGGNTVTSGNASAGVQPGGGGGGANNGTNGAGAAGRVIVTVW